MIRRAFLGLVFGLAASCAAAAQTAPSPADVGISKGSPDTFKLRGSDNVWTPFGTINNSTHIYIPATNGAIAPNDCVKWGPGLTSAGAACNSVTGGAHPANQLTIYTNHDGLVNNVTTPTEAWTVVQQGFYAPGDGGEAVYNWSLNFLLSEWNIERAIPTLMALVACCRWDRAHLQLGGTYQAYRMESQTFAKLVCNREGLIIILLRQTLMKAIAPINL